MEVVMVWGWERGKIGCGGFTRLRKVNQGFKQKREVAASGVGVADGVVEGIDPEGMGGWCLMPGWLCGCVAVKGMQS